MIITLAYFSRFPSPKFPSKNEHSSSTETDHDRYTENEVLLFSMTSSKNGTGETHARWDDRNSQPYPRTIAYYAFLSSCYEAAAAADDDDACKWSELKPPIAGL